MENAVEEDRLAERSKKVVPSRGSEQFMLRLPDGMREGIRAAAAESGRSMNTEIVAQLEEYPILARKIEDLQKQIASGKVEHARISGDLVHALNAIEDLERRLAGAFEAHMKANQELHDVRAELKSGSQMFLDVMSSIEKRMREANEEMAKWRRGFRRAQDTFKSLLSAVGSNDQAEMMRIYKRYRHFVDETWDYLDGDNAVPDHDEVDQQ